MESEPASFPVLDAASHPMLDAEDAVLRVKELLERAPLRHAFQVLGELRVRFPQEARLWHIHGLLAEDLGDSVEAEASYREALRLEPDSLDCALDLADFLLAEARADEGEAIALAATRRCPESARAHGLLGDARAQLGRASDAEADLRRAVELDPSLARACRRLAQLLCERGETEEALSVLRSALEADPGDPWTLACLGCVERRLGHDAPAEDCFRRALEIDTSVDSAFQGLFDLLLEKNRPVEAHALLTWALREVASGNLPASDCGDMRSSPDPGRASGFPSPSGLPGASDVRGAHGLRQLRGLPDFPGLDLDDANLDKRHCEERDWEDREAAPPEALSGG